MGGHSVDLRVGLLSYFLAVENRFSRPTIVEMDWAEHVTASAYIDLATSLPNHRFFRDQLRTEVARSLRTNTPLSLIMVDIDDFKSINDGLGHEVGNAVLASFGQLLRHHVQDSHIVARYGGEEFVVVLPATQKAEAALVAEALRAAVAAHRFEVGTDAAPLQLTISLGLATCPADARHDQDLIVAGDRALYQAKRGGKNQVRLFGASTRSFKRRKVTWFGTARPVGTTAFPIQTVEVGEGGLAFHANWRAEIGTLVEVELALESGELVQFGGRVAWSRSVDADAYEIAIRFVEQPPEGLARLSHWLESHD